MDGTRERPRSWTSNNHTGGFTGTGSSMQFGTSQRIAIKKRHYLFIIVHSKAMKLNGTPKHGSEPQTRGNIIAHSKAMKLNITPKHDEMCNATDRSQQQTIAEEEVLMHKFSSILPCGCNAPPGRV